MGLETAFYAAVVRATGMPRFRFPIQRRAYACFFTALDMEHALTWCGVCGRVVDSHYYFELIQIRLQSPLLDAL
jgi:hypothetical protein